jgi:Flp pilus assembly protein TadB
MKNILLAIRDGILWTVFIWGLINVFQFQDEAFTLSFVSMLAFGAVVGGLAFIYDVKNLSLLQKLAIHLGGSFLVFLVVAYINQWFAFTLEVLFWVTLQFILIFFIIWLGYYIVNKRDIKKINEKLKE